MCFQLFAELGVVAQELLDGVAALANLRVAVAEPRAAFLDDVELDAEVDDLAYVRDALAEGDFKLGLAERGRHFVFHHLDAHLVADGRVAVFEGRHLADVEAHAGVELQGVAAGCCFGVAEHDANFFAQLVDEDARRVRLADGGGELAQGLAHEAGLQAHLVVAHVAFDFRLWREGGHGVDDDDVDGRGADELVGYFEGLLAVVGLRDEQVVHVDAELGGIEAVEGVFGVDEGRDAARLLGLGNGVDGQRRLARRLGAVDLDDAAFGVAPDTQGGVEPEAARGDDVDVFYLFVAELHDGAFAEVFFYFSHGGLQGFELFARSAGLFFFFFCHVGWLWVIRFPI